MPDDEILYDVRDRVATITLNRPEQWNTLTATMLDDLIAAIARADDDPQVRAMVVTGAGGAFCAGADVSGGARTFDADQAGWGDDVEDFRDGGGRLTLRIFECTTPVIAAVGGVAAGLGATMLTAMDLVLAGQEARIGFVFARRGLVPEACATWFLPHRVGVGVALDWCLTGRLVPADEARDAGLVHSTHPTHEVLAAAQDLARGIAEQTSPVAVGMIRQMIWRFAGAAHPMDAHRVDSAMNYALGQSPDVAEGISAFLEKRSPDFPGRLPGDAPPAYPWFTEPPFHRQ